MKLSIAILIILLIGLMVFLVLIGMLHNQHIKMKKRIAFNQTEIKGLAGHLLNNSERLTLLEENQDLCAWMERGAKK